MTKSNLEAHAEHELALLAARDGDDELQRFMNENILSMIRVFSQAGHSGSSAAFAINCLQKLLQFEPILPLTGAPDEWHDVSEYGPSPCWQNKRCSHVFKGEDHRPYDIQAVVFVDEDGCGYSNNASVRFIEFPYTPKTEFVKVKRREESSH